MRFSTGLLLSAACVATPAFAAPISFKPLIDARLRYETVEQAPMIEDADALTLRARLGGEVTSGAWSVLAEAEGTLAIIDDYNDGLSATPFNGRGAFPLVADPENVEINRLQLQYRGLPKTVVTVGRQRINLDDQRFVGSVGWRQNEQTFDAARVEWSGIDKLKVDLVYSWSVRTIWGVDGNPLTTPPRPQAIGGDNIFANVGYTTPYGTLTGFAYLVDQDETPVALRRNSSQTYGARFAGAMPLSKSVKLSYAASYARQSDYAGNPIDYSADYLLGELGVETAGFKLLGGYEVLGADEAPIGAPAPGRYAFQTPYATLHKFQGWADKFLVTPPNGIQDLYGSVGYSKAKVGPFATIGATLVYHDCKSDIGDLDYGSEWNVQLMAKVRKYTFTLKYADHDAEDFATDTRKFWAQLEWAF